jgi:hypothetical protein
MSRRIDELGDGRLAKSGNLCFRVLSCDRRFLSPFLLEEPFVTSTVSPVTAKMPPPTIPPIPMDNVENVPSSPYWPLSIAKAMFKYLVACSVTS